MSATIEIRQERPKDREAIHALHRVAFGGDAEATLVDRLRIDGDLVLSLVAVSDQVVGHIAFSRLANDVGMRASALAPLAVMPSRQNAGIGSSLVERGLEWLKRDHEQLVLVLGDAAYYGRFGFTAECASHFRTPYDGDDLQGFMLSGEHTPVRPIALRYAGAFAELR